MGETVKITHGVSAAYYSNRGDGSQWAMMDCLCGETITGQTAAWEDAGYEMDVHIANALKDAPEQQQ